jgi:hypothetical protein
MNTEIPSTHSSAHAASGTDIAKLAVEVDAAVKRACDSIAPTWPLDRFIAVNPFWSRVDQPLTAVSSSLTALSGARLLMPRAWFRQEWQSGRLRAEHLRDAVEQSGSSATLAQLLALLESNQPKNAVRARVVDVVDSQRDLTHEMAWRDFVVHNTSQFCASYYDDGQSMLGPNREGGLYATWRRQITLDRSPSLLMGMRGFRKLAQTLPQSARETVLAALAAIQVPSAQCETYLQTLLLDLNGWASWCAYRGWMARLSGGEDGDIAELLAIRIAWEWLLLRAGGREFESRWRSAVGEWPKIDAAASADQQHDWLLQRAMEIAWQQAVCQQLPAGLGKSRPSEPAAVQAVFCIDVRSEVYRRALEAQSPNLQTLGFAGFFGIPIEYQPVGSASARPQLPGLLAPRLRVTDTGVAQDLAKRRKASLTTDASWNGFKWSPLSSFAFVDSLGVFFAEKLVRDSFGQGTSHHERSGLSSRDHASRKPRVTHQADGAVLTPDDRCKLAEGMLRAMSLTHDFARLVLLAGHGSETQNNPHAAGLDCGACCGQTGEVNARAAAALLNETSVRAGLRTRGIDVPATTHFVAGLHNTTTDEITLFDLDELPPSHELDLASLRQSLVAASAAARRERAPRLGLGALTDQQLAAAVSDRTRDWGQVRPEWGLADNAAFIVAPREHTRHLNLAGRSFLHEYRFEEDKDFAVLELIMTAPMVVTHWINLQYYASTVDNARYGSGNKVLHNVVGGHIGVFEGNGGDLRIGLPLQSLHDGERWVHTPLRLSVFIEAPQAAITAILQKHDKVRSLIDNEWLYLFQIEANQGLVRQYRQQRWVDVIHSAMKPRIPMTLREDLKRSPPRLTRTTCARETLSTRG